MKVAYVMSSLQKPSGWRSHAMAFLRTISRHVEPTLWVSQADYAEAQTLFPDFTMHVIPVTQGASLHHMSGLRALLASQRAIRRGSYPSADLVHSLEAYPTGLVGSWLAHKLRCPHVLTSHGTYGVIWRRYWLDRLVYRRVLADTRLVLPVSGGTAQAMQCYFGRTLRGGKVQPILNGNDYYLQVPQGEALQHRFSGPPTLLTVGDIKPRKGQDISLQAFALLKQELPQARYIIVGHYRQNDYFRSLERIIAERQLEDVTFTGVVSDTVLSDYYRQASLFVLTPQTINGDQFEGFGLVYLEAGAYGLPVVGTHSGGVADAVRDGETGLLLEMNNVEGIAQAMLRLLKDLELSAQMGRTNRLWSETLTWEKNAQAHLQAYQEVLQG